MSFKVKDNETAVSVIVPVYNLEKYIGDCIDSVLNQTLKNFELILIDDCSDDDTKIRIKEYMEREKTADIILLENDRNRNAGYSRNRGLDIARGKYLLFLDGDDMLEPDALERLYTACEETGSEIAVCNYRFYDNNTQEAADYHAPVDALLEVGAGFRTSDISDCVFQYFREMAWDKIFRREFIQENGIRFQSQRNANDQFFVYAAMLRAGKIVKISDYLMKYRKNRENQLSTSGNISRNPKCIWNATKATGDYIDDLGLYDLYQKSFRTYAVMRLLFSLKNVNSREAENLITFYKEEGFEALKIADCRITDFGTPYFFAVYNWLLHIESAEKIEETNKWKLWNDDTKCKKLFQMLMMEKDMVLWGVGVNGRKFLEKTGQYELDIRCIVDLDENKVGNVVCGYEVKHRRDIEDGDLIIALNPEHIFAIRHFMIQQKKKVKILDARAYLCFEVDYEQAKFDVF